MGSDKIFMFDNPAAGESAGIMSMIPALLQNKGLDPNLVAALMNGNKNQDAWGGAGCYWIWIILLFFLWGGNGFGNGFGNGANGIPAQLNNEAGRELLMNAIQGNGTAINQLASSLNCSTQQLQNAICRQTSKGGIILSCQFFYLIHICSLIPSIIAFFKLTNKGIADMPPL